MQILGPMIVYNLLIFFRPLIGYLGQQLKWDEQLSEGSFAAILLVKFLMRCIFYLFLFKMKIVSKYLEQGI